MMNAVMGGAGEEQKPLKQAKHNVSTTTTSGGEADSASLVSAPQP
jgi:hypothetical protein